VRPILFRLLGIPIPVIILLYLSTGCNVMVATVAAIEQLVEPVRATDEIAPATVAVPADDDAPSTPWDIKAVFQGGMFFLMLLAACYAAAEIILPIVVAFALMLVLQPAMRLLGRLYLPRGLAALVIILILFGTLAGLGTILSGPAASWAQKLPEGIPKLQERLSFLSEPIASFQKLMNRAENLAPGAETKPLPVKVEGTGLSERLLNGTRSVVSGLLETVLVLFFLLIYGDIFLRRLVEILPRFKNKRQVVDITNQIENDISAYLATITIMNAAVGVATGTVVALVGLGDPEQRQLSSADLRCR